MSNTCQAHNIIAADFYERLPKALQITQEDNLEFGNISVFRFFEVALNLICHLSIILTCLGVGYTCFKLKLEKTAFHACTCTLGLVCLLAEGMIVRYPSNLFLRSLSPDKKEVIHITLMIGGGILGLIGTAHKMYLKRVHFNTTHGKFGLATCIFWTINIILGSCVFAFKNYESKLLLILPIIHNFLGLLTLIMSCFCQYCGYKSGFFRRNFSNQGVYRKMIIIILVLTSFGPIKICVDNFLKFKKL